MAMGEWDDLNSSMLTSARYDPDEGILELRFVKGYTYAYKDVPKHVYDGLLAAESNGRYARENILNSYPYDKI